MSLAYPMTSRSSVLTAGVTPEARQRALADGASDFVTKPFDRIEVLLRVRDLIETRGPWCAASPPESRLEFFARRMYPRPANASRSSAREGGWTA